MSSITKILPLQIKFSHHLIKTRCFSNENPEIVKQRELRKKMERFKVILYNFGDNLTRLIVHR